MSPHGDPNGAARVCGVYTVTIRHASSRGCQCTISHRAQICGSVRHLRRGLRAALCHLVARAALTFKTIKQCCSLLLRSLLLSSALRQWVSQQQRAGNANPCVCPPCHRLKVRRLEALLQQAPAQPSAAARPVQAAEVQIISPDHCPRQFALYK